MDIKYTKYQQKHTDMLSVVCMYMVTSNMFRPLMVILREVHSTKEKYIKIYKIGLTEINVCVCVCVCVCMYVY
jgi:hypothetical protein